MVLKPALSMGEFFSVLIRNEVGEMEHCLPTKTLAGYTGLVPFTYASGKRITSGRLAKEGNNYWL